jgi:DNA repair protein RadC
VLKFEELFTGTLDSAAVYPREVVRKVIDQCCAAVVLCHNHPSGSVNVSDADRAITLRLQEALALVDVKVLDHLIIANNKVVSFAEHGLL